MRPSDYGDPYPITRALIEDGRRWSILGGPVGITAPVRILQGGADPDVPWRHALELAEAIESKDVVFTLIRDMRGGRDYDSQWGTRMKGTGPMAWMIGRRFEVACDKLGLNKRRTKLTTDHFVKPKRSGQQLSLF